MSLGRRRPASFPVTASSPASPASFVPKTLSRLQKLSADTFPLLIPCFLVSLFQILFVSTPFLHLNIRPTSATTDITLSMSGLGPAGNHVKVIATPGTGALTSRVVVKFAFEGVANEGDLTNLKGRGRHTRPDQPQG